MRDIQQLKMESVYLSETQLPVCQTTYSLYFQNTWQIEAADSSKTFATIYHRLHGVTPYSPP
jgi:hypothetical protein